jgi:dCMP deaminase
MSTTERPSWDAVWMSMAENIGKRTRCVRAQRATKFGGIGCVIVSADNRVVSTSYAGPPAGYEPANEDPESTCEQWCPRARKTDNLDPGYTDCVSSHAEQSAIARAEFAEAVGGVAYVNSAVCLQCAKLLATALLARVVMRFADQDTHRFPSGSSVEYLRASGVEVEVWPA